MGSLDIRETISMDIVTVVSPTHATPSPAGEKPTLLGADNAPDRNIITGILCGDLDAAQKAAAAARKEGLSIGITVSELKVGACGYKLQDKRQ